MQLNDFIHGFARHPRCHLSVGCDAELVNTTKYTRPYQATLLQTVGSPVRSLRWVDTTMIRSKMYWYIPYGRYTRTYMTKTQCIGQLAHRCGGIRYNNTGIDLVHKARRRGWWPNASLVLACGDRTFFLFTYHDGLSHTVSICGIALGGGL